MKKIIFYIIIFLTVNYSFSFDGLRKDYRDPKRQRELEAVLQKLGFDWKNRDLYDKKNKQTLENQGYSLITDKKKILTKESEQQWKINQIFAQTYIENKEKPYKENTIPKKNEKTSIKKNKNLEFEKIKKDAKKKDDYFYNFNYDLHLNTEFRYTSITGNESYSPYSSDGFFSENILFHGKKYFESGGFTEINLDTSYTNDRNFNDKRYRLDFGNFYIEKSALYFSVGNLRPFLMESTSSIDITGVKGGIKSDNFLFETGYGYNNRGINDKIYSRDSLWGRVEGNIRNWFKLGIHFININDIEDSVDNINLPPEENWVWGGFIDSYIIKNRLHLNAQYAYSEWNPDKNSIADNKKQDHLYNMFLNYTSRKTSWNFKYKLVGENFTALNGNYVPDSETSSFQLRYKFNKQIESFIDIFSQDFEYSSDNPEKIFEPRISVNLKPFTDKLPLTLKISHGTRSRRDEAETLYKRYDKSSYIFEYKPIKNKAWIPDMWNFGFYIDNEMDYYNRDKDYSRHTWDFNMEKNLFNRLNINADWNYYRQNFDKTLDIESVTSWYLKSSYYINAITGLDSGIKFKSQDNRGSFDDFDYYGVYLKIFHNMTVKHRLEFELNYDDYNYWDSEETRKDINSIFRIISDF